MSNHTEQEVLARLGAHVTAFALRHGWKSDGPEGAFEYIQRISYTQGMDDARPYWVRTYRDLEDHDASIQQAIEKTEERVRFVLQGGLLDGRPNQAQEKEAARQWDEWAGEMNRCRDFTLEQVARICDEEGREWDSDALVTTKNYAAHCATRIRALKKVPHQGYCAVRDFTTAWAEFEQAGYRYGQDALEQVEFGFKIALGLRPAYNPHIEPHCAALASAPVPVLKDWRIDTSAGGPILVYKDCSVIESAQAEYVLRLIAADQASATVADEQPIKLSDEVLNFLKEGVENATQCEEADVDQEFADQLLLLTHTPLYTEPRPKQREVDWGPLVVAPVAGEAQALPTVKVGGKEYPQQWFTAKEVRQLLGAAPPAEKTGLATLARAAVAAVEHFIKSEERETWTSKRKHDMTAGERIAAGVMYRDAMNKLKEALDKEPK